MLWTDEENRNFVSTFYPWFLKTYDELPLNIHRIDAVRYMYLHHYGGVYVDLDFESLRPIDEYLKGKQLVLGRMGYYPNFVHSIPNAVMASVPGHPFWVDVLNYIHIHRKRHWGAELLTGPAMLFKLYGWNSHKDYIITLSDSGIFIV
jgi:mannosyltransferase OCH1-like enzyme